MTYYVYMIRCGDGSLYTGSTSDVARRFAEHSEGKGAKYTRSRGAVSLEACWKAEERGSALSLEARIKRLSRGEKLALVAEEKPLGDFFGEDYAAGYERLEPSKLLR